jgi:hypothetical protein
MARSLQINVQIDQLPPGSQAAYFGVRVSAFIEPDGADPTPSSDRHILVPWEWTGADPTRPGSWNPGDPSSWKAWWIDPATSAATPAQITPLPNADANNPLPPIWLSALEQALNDLASVPTRLEGPPKTQDPIRRGPVSDRTLFGFVESLTTFPAPWPEAHKVWTYVRVDTAAPSAHGAAPSAHELVVAPVFGINNGVAGAAGLAGTYAIQTNPTIVPGAGSDHVWNITYQPNPNTILKATAVVDRLREVADDGSRLILQDKFLVAGATKSWAAAGGQDWMIQLPGQIAEILDPARGFSQALEQVLGQLATAHPQTTGAQGRALRFLLAAAHWRLFAPAATGTRTFTPLQVALGRARGAPDGQNMLGGLTARDAAKPVDGTGFFSSEKLQVWSDDRVLALLGLPNDSGDTPPDWGPRVDTPDGLRSFLINHWANSPAANKNWQAGAATVSNAGPTALMQLAAFQWNNNQITADPTGTTGAFDLTALTPDKGVDVSFTFNVSKAGPAVGFIAKLYFDNLVPAVGGPAVATVTPPQVSVADGAHTLTLSVSLSPQQAAPPAAPGAVPPAGPAAQAPPRRFQFGVSIDGGAKFVDDIRDPALGAQQDLSAQSQVLAARRASVTLELTTAGSTVALAGTLAPDVVKQIIANTPDAALRANFSLAYAAPFIPAILAGIGPNVAAAATTPAPGAQAPDPIQKIAAAVGKWAEFLLTNEGKAAENLATALANRPSPPVSPADLQSAQALFEQALKPAITNAQAQAARLFASHATTNPDLDYRVAVKAEPIVFPIDQPQPIDGAEDLWSIFSGMGILAGISTGAADTWPTNNIWYSLNVASMYAPGVDPQTHVRYPLLDQPTPPPNSLPPNRVGDAGAFDPVPLQISETGTVRAANVTYENRSLVGEMPHDPGHVRSRAAGNVPRRIEAYRFPIGANLKLPALCFGKRYFFLPYLIGHGGALPICLRDPAVTAATKLRPKTKAGDTIIGPDGHPILGPDGHPLPDPGGRIVLTNKNLKDDLNGSGVTPDQVVRQIDYVRTTPVAAPRLDGEKDLPGIPDGVDALAGEIPVRPTPITLAAGESAYYYRNKERTEGTLDFTSDAGERALQIDFGGLLWSSAPPPPRADLQVVVRGRDDGGPLLDVTIRATDWPQDARCGLRLVAGRYGIELFQQQLDDFVERPPQFTQNPLPLKPGAVDFGNWKAFSISISNIGNTDATFVPPIVSMGTKQGDDRDRQVTDPHEVPLPEAAHKRAIIVLDGFPPAPGARASRDLTSVELKVRRPAVEFATYERWINWDLTDPEIRKALDDAHKLVAGKTPTAADDLTIDDPAVERIVVELVGLFPKLAYYGRGLLPKDWSAPAALIEGIKTSVSDDQTLTVTVNPSATDATAISGTVKNIVLAPGGVYEVRLYGAVPEAKQAFAASLPDTGARFGKGVWQGLLKFSDGSKNYRLGAPLVRTCETATPLMPALWKSDADPDAPLEIQRQSPPSVPADRAQIGLTQQFVTDNYNRLRYVSRVSLLSQRWGWRGRPLAMLHPNDLSGIGDTAVRLSDDDIERERAKDFEDAAFIERRVDDIGVIEETKLHLAHVLPPLAAAKDNRPPIFLKDLRYLGGANWWRFALEATSRYAAMKPNLDLTSYSHIDPKDRFTPHWHTLIVRDRDGTGRKPKRPALLLVLPLTETIMADAAVPPLLALFSEPMFANFHIGDGIEAALDYVRHPLPDAAITWNGLEGQAANLMTAIAAAYGRVAANGGDQALKDLRVAVANFNVLVRSRAVALANDNVTNAQKKFADAATLVQKISQEPDSAPDKALRLADANNALQEAMGESVAAASALAAANADATSAQQDLVAVQQGQARKLPDLQPLIQRFWPQVGPDPILTATPHPGRPVPVRLDGPLGYTFDVETEAPNFGRSGYLMTPVGGQDAIDGISDIGGLGEKKIPPWTLTRVRFRRLEAVELSNYRPQRLNRDEPLPPLLLTSDGISPPPTDPMPSEFHEGLVVDFPELDDAAGAKVSVVKGTSFGPTPVSSPPDPPDPDKDIAPWIDRYMRVKVSLAPDALSVFLDTDLGPAGTYNVPLKPTSRVWLRLVLSQRDKPEKSEKPYEPVLDISVRLLIDDDEVDGLARSQAGSWLTVACLPLLAGGKYFKPPDPVYVDVAPDRGGDHAPHAVGVRLTPFTAPLWCQFTQDVSRFDVTTTAPNAKSQSCPVANLAATLDAKNVPQLQLVAPDGTLQTIQSVKWLATDPKSQIEGVVAAIVTEFVTDAFDRVRERPVGVYRIVDGQQGPGGTFGAATMKQMWLATDAPTAKLTGARVRLMSLMRLKRLDPWRPPPETLADYFAEPFADSIAMDAPDATGRILGVSKPIEIGLTA